MARIIVIEDEELVRYTIKLTLESVGHTVLEATNGREGLALLDQTTCDLVITDIIMPEMEGIETIAGMRSRTANLPIIAVSGGGRIGNMDFLKAAKELGATTILPKPFEPDELLELVDRYLAEVTS